MASKRRRALFWVILLVLEDILLIVLLAGGICLLKASIGRRRSRFERDLAHQGLTSDDYRARAPYVMFRPRPSRNAAPYQVKMGCFRDFRGFCTTVHREGTGGAAGPSRRIWEVLAPEARSIITNVADGQDASAAEQSKLLAQLNALLTMPELYSQSHFRGIELPDDAKTLLRPGRRPLRDYEVARLNRHLLNVAYSATLAPADVIDSRGFWSPEISQKKKPGEFRIAMVGGSVVFCAPSHELSAVAQLAKRMKQDIPALRNKKVTYINAGLPSGVSGQELAQFIHHLLPLDIDMLVVFDGFNDIYLPLSYYDRRPGYPYDYIVEEYRYYKFLGAESWSATFMSLFDPILLGASPKKSVKYYCDKLEIRDPTDEEIQPRMVDIYMANVSHMATFANAYGIRAAVFLQPYSPDMGPPSQADPMFSMPKFDLFRQAYAQVRQRYRAEAGNNTPMRIFDDLPRMAGELRKLFVDVAHYRQDPGNAMVAKRMVDAMKEAGAFKE